MDVDAVESIGHQMIAKASSLGSLGATAGRLIQHGHSLWQGSSSRHWFEQWQREETAVRRLIHELDEMGRKLLAQAKEQRDASRANLRMDSAAKNSSQGDGSAGGTTSSPAANPGGSTGAGDSDHARGIDRTWQQVREVYDRDYVAKYGLWSDGGPNGDNRYQCVSWAWFRMRELGYHGPQIQGDGGVLAARLGGTTTTEPQPGAVVSSSNGGFGHVMIAERVYTNSNGQLEMLVSEMNAKGLGADHGLEGLPQEYQCETRFSRNPDGSWGRVGGGPEGKLTIWNPPY